MTTNHEDRFAPLMELIERIDRMIDDLLAIVDKLRLERGQLVLERGDDLIDRPWLPRGVG